MGIAGWRNLTWRLQPIPYERPIALLIGGAALAFAAYGVAEVLLHWDHYYGFTDDFTLSIDRARDWLATGQFYLPFQFTGPYEVLPWAEIYPPPVLLLYLPWLVLPAVLWWFIPIGTSAWIVWSHHPRPLAWAAIAVCLAFPTTLALVYWGNSGMWFVAALALGTRYGWPAALIVVKLGLAPFALIGIWHRSWFLAAAGVAIAALAFTPMWLDYIKVMGNLRGASPFYSISSVPAMCIPLFAWLGRTRTADAPESVAVSRDVRRMAPDAMLD